jgi:hypothetical protein
MKQFLLLIAFLLMNITAFAAYDPKMMEIKIKQTVVLEISSQNVTGFLNRELLKGEIGQYCMTVGKMEQAINTLKVLLNVSKDIFKNYSEEYVAIDLISIYLTSFKIYCENNASRPSSEEIEYLQKYLLNKISAELDKLSMPMEFQ